LHFSNEDEEEGEVKSTPPVKSVEIDNDRLDDKDTGLLSKEEQSTFHQENYELISRSKIYFRAYNKEWRRRPIRRDKNKVPIGRDSFWQCQSFDYSKAEL